MAEQNISMNFQYGTQSLNYYFRRQTINQQQYSIVHQVMKNLYNAINNSVKNSNNLHNASRQLKREVNTAKFEYQSAINRQTQASEVREKLSRLLKTSEVAYESQKTSYDNLIFEQDELEKEIQRKEQDIKNEANRAEEDMQPIRQRYQNEIDETKNMIEKTKNQSLECEKNLTTNLLTITSIKQEILASEAEEKKLNEQKLKIINSPQHYLKSAQNLQIEIIGMDTELKMIEDELDRKTKICNANDLKKEQQIKLYEELQKQKQNDEDKCRDLETQIDKLKNENLRINNYKENEKLEITEIEIQIENQIRARKYLQETISICKKATDHEKKVYKKLEHQKKQNEDQILQLQNIITKFKKQQVDIHNEMRGSINQSDNLKEEIINIQNKTLDIKGRVQDSETYKKSILEQIIKREKTLAELKKNVQLTEKQVNNLTEMRQSMARKASSAMSEVRSTQQTLKVKQLFILDLTKKYHQTQNDLDACKILYQQVKLFRKKYMDLIQNSSQDLAELKQRIKILQNQLEILTNQSKEKNKTIQGYNQMLQIEKHKRDQMKSQLNKCQFQKKEKLELIDQNINEIEKLNMIVLSLNKDVQRLKNNFADVLENRNYTGIQLIDRNDELCILYEKENTQQKVLRRGEMAIKSLDDEIRMINIEKNQTNRKIKIARDKIMIIPKLAEKVLELQKELEKEQKREEELSKELENPHNNKKLKQLQGEDPDEQSLDAKISVLEERLNLKKEQLLEKELVLDEVTHLVDEFKQRAEVGRQSTLQVSEKINDFQSRLKDLTRKMKAILSEMAICQANSIRYQQQREKLAKVVETARGRMEKGFPPTPETEIDYFKIIRDKKRFQQERQNRLQREMIEQNYPPFATKTTAEHRVNAYIPDEIGLPKPYGMHAPFKPSDQGTNMRHFKKPKIREIEI